MASAPPHWSNTSCQAEQQRLHLESLQVESGIESCLYTAAFYDDYTYLHVCNTLHTRTCMCTYIYMYTYMYAHFRYKYSQRQYYILLPYPSVLLVMWGVWYLQTRVQPRCCAFSSSQSHCPALALCFLCVCTCWHFL